MRRQSNAVKPIVTTLVMVTLPHCLPCSIMMLKRAMAHSCLQLSTRRTVKQINSHFGTLLYWHSLHSPDYQWYLLLEVWEGGCQCQPPCLLDARESRDDGLGCRCTVHQLAAHKPRCRVHQCRVQCAPARCTSAQLCSCTRSHFSLLLHGQKSPPLSSRRPNASFQMIWPAD